MWFLPHSGAAPGGEGAPVGAAGGKVWWCLGGLPCVRVAWEGGLVLRERVAVVVRVRLLGGACWDAFWMVDWEGPVVCEAGGGLVQCRWWRFLVGALSLGLLRSSWVVVTHGHAGLRAGGAGLVCLGRWVVMVVGVVVLMAVVVGVVVVAVLWVWAHDPLGHRRNRGWMHVHHVQP